MWSSESPQYGGRGMAAMWPKGWWRIPAESAVVLGAGRERRPTKSTVRRRTA
jgi:hypothetical protein